jgi:hypothetical protein
VRRRRPTATGRVRSGSGSPAVAEPCRP